MSEGFNWETILIAAIGLIVLLLFAPGLKKMLEDSRHAPKDWPGLLIPLAGVVAFVILLILLV